MRTNRRGLELELPPHARRILNITELVRVLLGTTSACAENTAAGEIDYGIPGNYLRMRGEYFDGFRHRFGHWELPPHARRIQLHPRKPPTTSRTTSACAENTSFSGVGLPFDWNYLRMRGEYSNTALKVSGSTELPPHARRIQTGTAARFAIPGTTSACAENTYW